MKVRISVIITALLIIGMTGSSVYISQAGELNVPVKNVISGELTSQVNNNLFFDVPKAFEKVTSFTPESGDIKQYVADGKNRYLFSTNQYSPFTDTSGNNVVQITNATNDALQVSYRSEYYDLSTSLKENTTLENIPLKTSEQYMFTVNLEKGVMYAITYQIITSSAQVDIKFTFVDSNGSQQSNTKSSRPRVSDFLIFKPASTGIYTVSIESLTENIILSSMEILSDFKVIDIEEGYTEVFKGETSAIKLFRLNTNTSTLNLVKFFTTLYTNSPVGNYADPNKLLGDFDIRFYDVFSPMFGTPLIVDTIIVPGDELLVSVVALPPDDSDPYVSGEKSRLGIDKGFEIEYSFWIEKTPIDNLELNTDFRIENAGDSYYSLSLPEESVLSINSSDYTSLQIYNLDTQNFYFINSFTNDLLNSFNISKIVPIPAGDYLIIASPINSNTNVRITRIQMDSLLLDRPVERSFAIDKIVVYKLRTTSVSKDNFVLTYMDRVNMSVSFSLNVYDSEGSIRDHYGVALEHYANNADPNYVSANETTVGDASELSKYNVNTAYVAVKMTGNKLWNSTFVNPVLIDSNVRDIQSTLRIERVDFFQKNKEENPDYDYRVVNLVSSYTQDLNYSKSTILTVLSFKLGYGGYSLSIDSENMSYSPIMLLGMNDIWFNNPPVIKGGNITHYTTNWIFGPSEPTDFIVVLFFDPTADGNVDDGILKVTLSSFTPTTFSDLKVGSIGVKKFTESVNTDIEVVTETTTTADDTSSPTTTQGGFDFTNPFVLGGTAVVALLATGGGVFFFLKKKKSI